VYASTQPDPPVPGASTGHVKPRVSVTTRLPPVNLSVVEAVVVSDPVKLALTADNVNELWNLGNGGADSPPRSCRTVLAASS
jgi:hypothetical protein